MADDEGEHEHEGGGGGDDCERGGIAEHYGPVIAADPAVHNAWKKLQRARSRARQTQAALLTAHGAQQATTARRANRTASASVVRARAKYKQAHSSAVERMLSNNCAVNVPTPVPTPAPTPAPTGNPPNVSGSFTGAVSKLSPFGNVQVKIIVSGGKITSVSAPVYPAGGRSGSINRHAIPILCREAVTAQSASVASVSGASYTSPAFKQSLQSALTKAGR